MYCNWKLIKTQNFQWSCCTVWQLYCYSHTSILLFGRPIIHTSTFTTYTVQYIRVASAVFVQTFWPFPFLSLFFLILYPFFLLCLYPLHLVLLFLRPGIVRSRIFLRKWGIELATMAMDQIKKKSTCQVQCKASSGGAASFHMCAIVRHQNLYQATNRGQGHIRFLMLYQRSSPFTHCATTAPVLRHLCRYCVTSAGTASPVPVLHHQCR